MTDPIVTAGIPEAIAILKAAQTCITTIIANPLNAAGAAAIFEGTVLLQFPALAAAEQGAVATDVNNVFDGWVQKLEASQAAASKPAA